MSHPVIDGINKQLATMQALTDEGRHKAFAAYRLHTEAEKTALFQRLNDQEQQDPARLDPKQIERYHELEIAAKYLEICDYANAESNRNLKKIIDWQTPTGQPTLAAGFRRAHDHAAAPKAEPRDKFAVTVVHNPQP
jgi:hypothetical protein